MGKLIYYYGLIARTTIFLGSFFVPAPYRYLQVAILGPYILLAWINVTNPKKVNESVWSFRIIFVSVVLITLGAASFYLSAIELQNYKGKNTIQYSTEGDDTSKKLVASLSAEIAKLREELKNNKPRENEDGNLSGLIDLIESGATPSPRNPIGQIKTIGESEIDIYEKPNTDSLILGIAIPNRTYSYFQKNSDWYLISLDGGVEGWIEKSSTKELQ